VVVFGNAESPLAELLLDRGARSVHVHDANDERLVRVRGRNASRNVSYGEQTETVSKQDRSFDFAIVENLTDGATASETLERLVRSLAARGAALIGVPNAEARLGLGLAAKTTTQPSLDYYELYDLVAEHFSDVRMLGQLPFVGYAIADFSAEREADISVDTAFVPGGAEEPEWFWALCSQEPIIGEAFSIIQLPLSQALAARPTASKDNLASPVPDAKLAELQSQLSEREQALGNLKNQAAATERRTSQLEADLERVRAEATAGAAAIAQQGQWATEREQLLVRLQQAEQAAQAPQNSGLLAENKVAVDDEVGRLETQLRERAELITQLQGRLLEAERVVGDLVRELDTLRKQPTTEPSSPQSSEVSELKSQLDNLALANAERATLLASAEATIRELEHKLQ
jgi:predicted  nucleic acid-binding Zn-ribbon protein